MLRLRDRLRDNARGSERILLRDSKPAKLVAEQILWLRREVETTSLQVTWLVYLCHGWMLALGNRALINEPIEAWYYGPMISSLHHLYKAFEGGPITDIPGSDQSSKFDEEQLGNIEGVSGSYGGRSALELSSLVIQRDTPWDIISRRYDAGAIIPNELIREYYLDLVNSTKTDTKAKAKHED